MLNIQAKVEAGVPLSTALGLVEADEKFTSEYLLRLMKVLKPFGLSMALQLHKQIVEGLRQQKQNGTKIS